MPASVAGIAREHVEAYIADLFERGRSPSTARTRFTGLHRFFEWCVEDGEITRSPMERMRMPTVPEQPVAVLDDDQIRALLAECSGRSFADVRHNAMIRLFIDSGMRVGEIAGLRVDDLDFEAGPRPCARFRRGGLSRHLLPPGVPDGICEERTELSPAAVSQLVITAGRPLAAAVPLLLPTVGQPAVLKQAGERRVDDPGTEPCLLAQLVAPVATEGVRHQRDREQHSCTGSVSRHAPNAT
jgi:Phage integrase family